MKSYAATSLLVLVFLAAVSMSRRCLACALFLMSLMLPLRGQADDWPQFRGPNCTGISTGTSPLPTKFSATENLRWSAKVGDGVGCAVIAAGRVFVSGMTADEVVSLFAFDAATGERLWRRDWTTGPLAEVHATNSQASATPAADAERVYFYFSSLGLLTLDARTGEDVWRQKLPTPFFVFKWGPGMSPVLYRDLVLFCQDDDLYPAFYAFEKTTGDLRWKDERLDMAVNYSHPVVCTVDGRDQIVVGGTGMLIGYDPESGRRRWSAKVLLRNIKTTPVCVDGVIYVSLQSGGIANQWIVSVDRDKHAGNNDGKLDKTEIQAFVGKQPIPEAFFRRTFDRGDLNKDGFLDGAELDIAFCIRTTLRVRISTRRVTRLPSSLFWRCVAAARAMSLDRTCCGNIRRSIPTISFRRSSPVTACFCLSPAVYRRFSGLTAERR